MLPALIAFCLVDTQVVEAKTVVEMVSTLHAHMDQPVFLGSALDAYEIKLEIPVNTAEGETLPEAIKDHWIGATKGSVISGITPPKDLHALVARPTFVSPNMRRSFNPIRKHITFGIRGKEFRDDQRPATPLADFKIEGDSVVYTGSGPASMEAINFKKLFDKPIEMHWLVEEMWVAMQFESMTKNDFLKALAMATCATVVENENGILLDIDPKALREAWKGKLEWISRLPDPNMPIGYKAGSDEAWALGNKTRALILDYFTDAEIYRAAIEDEKLGSYKFTTPDPKVDQAVKDFARFSFSDPENRWNGAGSNTAQNFMKQIEWDKFDWRVRILFPSIEISAPNKDMTKYILVY